ncbi:CLC_0170 family protein [Effusibacillus consociatus]|uniref:CLC_0170 family protein n=1 Tax=Effusibacillus consociatus TaxID=1117041 RepID=A0ABV9Q399_9BACL
MARGNWVKQVKLLCVLLITFPLLTGCWDRLEIEDRAVVLGLEVDESEITRGEASRMINIGYIQYVVVLFLVTGFMIWRFDAKGYDLKQMEKEKKAARFLGGLNVSLGILTYVANWVYQSWF